MKDKFKQALGNLSQPFRSLVREAGVTNIRPHDLRHTYASLAFLRGDDPEIIGERMGHSNVGFAVDTYVKTFPTQRKHAAFGINDQIFQAQDANTGTEDDG